MQRPKKRMVRIVQWTVIVYCAIGLAFYFLQDFFLFRPVVLPSDYSFSFKTPFREVNIPLNKTDTINLVQFLPDSNLPKKGVVLYFHGNRGNINRYARLLDPFLKNGYEVWMPDYPGFGKSRGAINEENLLVTGIETQKLAQTKFSNDSIIVYGKSLGTGVASYVAANSKNKVLVLETPYSSIPNLYAAHTMIYPAKRMAKYNLDSYKYMDSIDEDVVIFHGTADGVIPISSALELKQKFKKKDKFYTIPDATHRTACRTQIYYNAMDSLLNQAYN